MSTIETVTSLIANAIGRGRKRPGSVITPMLDDVHGNRQQEGSMRIASRAGLLARLSAGILSRQLDEELAEGTPPEAAAALVLRARRLTTLSRRRAIADGLRRVIRDTYRVGPPSQARISPRMSEVLAASDELARLADALAIPGPVAARGVAQAWILLTDGTGPLYNPNSTANLQGRAASAAHNLHLED